jgi:hypothetical protein
MAAASPPVARPPASRQNRILFLLPDRFGFMSRLFLLIILSALAGTPSAADQPSLQSTAALLLDDKQPADSRNHLIEDNADRAGDIIAEMTRGLGDDSAEEYRRIPWIWRVAVAAGKRNDLQQLRRILEVSLPHPGEKLRDWQAVVIGGGVINGITLAGEWPGPRLTQILGDDASLKQRWQTALEQASSLADDEKVTRGTRYDALRMIPLLGWDASGAKLRNYLKKGTHAELQMGAVSGCGDINDARAVQSLIEAIPNLDPKNLRLAVNALKRTSQRKQLLNEAIAAGRVSADVLNAK